MVRVNAATLIGIAGGAALGGGLWLTLNGAFAAVEGNAPARKALDVRTLLTDRRRALRAVGVLGAAAAAWAVTGWPVAALLAAAAAWWLPGLLGPDREHHERLERIEAVAAWTEQVRDLMSAASGLQSAITATAPIAPASIREHVVRLAERIRTDHPHKTLTEFAEAVDTPTADLVAAALSNAATRHAADLGALLSGLAEATREQAAMLVRVAATRARVHTAMRIITATTLALAVLLLVFNPTYLAPYDGALGQLVLAGIGALWALALTWLARLSRTDLGPRVLRAEPHAQVST
ncbi:type II secretion system F family protein [Nocardiopsis chromatogenes]|uniref:type II secretion system F family protein n=1 Tax=Nocardiopsis chromatogenes TaxID=280239 RepID=UPI0003811E43|nr:hypothetical protein [Nocardiopsis chromatogenes]